MKARLQAIELAIIDLRGALHAPEQHAAIFQIESELATLRVELGLEPHIADQEVASLKETNSRLNRRCQAYERALAEKVREHGPSMGRALANAAATMYREQLQEVLPFLEFVMHSVHSLARRDISIHLSTEQVEKIGHVVATHESDDWQEQVIDAKHAVVAAALECWEVEEHEAKLDPHPPLPFLASPYGRLMHAARNLKEARMPRHGKEICGWPEDKKFKCTRCERTVCYCEGANDDTPALCNECAQDIQEDSE